MSQTDKELSELDNKILRDFHFNAPQINNEVQGTLPTITNKAKIFIESNLTPGSFFRFGIAGGGCSGFNYLLDEDTEQSEDDIIFCDLPKAVVDRESLKYLYGSIIELEEQGFGKNLVIENPGAKSSCGCGSSFNFDFDLLND